MSQENEKTLAVYERHAADYLRDTKAHLALNPEKAQRKRQKLADFLRQQVATLPPHGKAFEIGSADGENARFLQDLGLQVTAGDVAAAFIAATRAQGVPTIKFNVLQDAFLDVYHLILCWRVFVHFTSADAAAVLAKVYQSLVPGGIFIFNAMNRAFYATDEEWVDFTNEYHIGEDRYYKYHRQADLDAVIAQIGFTIQSFHCEGGNNGQKWLVYVLRK